MSYEQVSDHPGVQAAYEAMRRDGQSHRMAEMLALRQCPSLRTNATILAAESNRAPHYDLEEDNLHSRAIVKTANRLGVHPRQYQPTYADFPGDPKAYLPNDDPGGHLKKLDQLHKDRQNRLIDTEPNHGT